MVERFERDIVPLKPNYMILHGGTNDYGNIHSPSLIEMLMMYVFELLKNLKVKYTTT